MKFDYLFNRLFHREAWKAALSPAKDGTRFGSLSRQTAQVIFFHYEAVIQHTGSLRHAPATGAGFDELYEINSRMEQLRQLLPFANLHQQGIITDAERTAAFARSLVPPLPDRTEATKMTYYSVFIPTLGGHFYYLGAAEYQPDDIVSIPFGGENKMIYGIVTEVFHQNYWEIPLPLWKMKYIDSKAPQAVADEYHQKGAE